MKSNYFISRDIKSGEVVYLEYNKNGYKVSPKVKKSDAIEVNKIVFVSPSLTEKLLKKKINNKISKLLLELSTFYEDSDDSGSDDIRVRDMLKEAEKLKYNLINNYKKYLDGNYVGLTLKKIQIIIDGYNSRVNAIEDKRQKQIFMDMLARANMPSYSDNLEMYDNTKKGKGR